MRAKAGDTVYVKAGVYSDRVNIRTSGTPNFPITLTAWKDDRVLIGSEPVDAAAGRPVEADPTATRATRCSCRPSRPRT